MPELTIKLCDTCGASSHFVDEQGNPRRARRWITLEAVDDQKAIGRQNASGKYEACSPWCAQQILENRVVAAWPPAEIGPNVAAVNRHHGVQPQRQQNGKGD